MGIGAACHVQTEAPGTTYAVLEAREASGGTWDLFRYPGIRSDSDMFTLGYSFRPWTEPDSIAGGEAILSYIRQTASDHGVEQHIRFSSPLFTVSAEADEGLVFRRAQRTGSVGVPRVQL